MAITMKQVTAHLSKDEPDYRKAAMLGPAALPFLAQLVTGEDRSLAAKATYLVAFIDAEESASVMESAARSSDVILRVAAAGALRYLTHPSPALVNKLLMDGDSGVRKWALRCPGLGNMGEAQSTLQWMAIHEPNLRLRTVARGLVSRTSPR